MTRYINLHFIYLLPGWMDGLTDKQSIKGVDNAYSTS